MAAHLAAFFMGQTMDRQIVYPGAIPLETDLLNTNKYAMMGLAKLAAAMMGSNTYLHGLACTPSSPASMIINVAKGQIYSLQNVDGTAYSSLAADTTNTILKQGVILNSTAFTLTAPTTAGQSINYLIQVAYNDVDSGATVLPYYNAANPSVAYSGPNNAGTAQNTVRSGVCTVALKAGVAATTGTQATPVADTGYTAAWVITVAQGATSVTAANIAVAPNAPFLPATGIFSAIQQGSMTFAADTGAANTYAASFIPNLPAPVDGMRLTFKAKTANTGPSTFAANGGTAYPLYSHANQALQGGEIISNGLVEVEWNSSLTAWVLCGNSGGALPVAPATQDNHALQLAQATGRLLNVQVFYTSGTYTATIGTKKVIVEMVGGGGGSAGSRAADTGNISVGGAGGAGSYAKGQFTQNFNGVQVVVGSKGAGGTTTGPYATIGGTSSFGSLLSAAGGSSGQPAGPTNSFPFSTVAAVVSSGATGANIVGTPGQAASASIVVSASVVVESPGGSSQFGAGGFITAFNSKGVNGSGYGAGGGPSKVNGGNAAVAGGDGSQGLVIVWEYA
ncbi:phage tail protein [Pantoea sp. ACRSB]|uniref:phage tail protein n=1 Tax=Pantoea sp. ACRSB TaxID=2918207 RepID=UPI00289365CD|nr:phage tail protein [Pantoea sp. ACRSB]MCG7388740.1 phage tail protein [Pantoea sp. ACRSB]